MREQLKVGGSFEDRSQKPKVSVKRKFAAGFCILTAVFGVEILK